MPLIVFRGDVGTVKLLVYTAVPNTYLTLLMYPLNPSSVTSVDNVLLPMAIFDDVVLL